MLTKKMTNKCSGIYLCAIAYFLLIQVDAKICERLQADIVCEPVCMPACENGHCKSPGECACQTGYHPDPKDNHRCLPSCQEGCGHGTCVAPNLCRCDFGNTLVNGACPPVCTDPCLNGTCIATDTCECLPGFRKSERNLCEPYCSNGCDNGICAAPETCRCNPGWKLEDNKCVAECKRPCGNGICVAPDTCKCFPGYHIDFIYRMYSFNSNPEATVCVPTFTDCKGDCVAPNKFLRHRSVRHASYDSYGYDYYDEMNYGDLYNTVPAKPKPYCSNGCDNGVCTAAETCTCNIGFTLQDNKCVVGCNPPCGNGTCTSSMWNMCNCFPGYRDITMGFHKPGASRCEPVCPGCERVNCVAPNVCVGDTTTQKHDDLYSEPNVEFTTTTPEFYEYDTTENPADIDFWSPLTESTTEKAKPYCSYGCNNGICLADETCRCNIGFMLQDHKCVVACNPPCGNGTCTSSRWNICNCFPGYRQHFANSTSVPSSRTPRASFEHPAARLSHDELHFHEPPSQCWPVCYGCKGANCVAPNVCVGDTTTQKHDDLYSEPNVEFTTTTPEFYEYDTTENPADIDYWSPLTESTTEKAKPYCSYGCDNGICIADETCRCNIGFMLQDHKCVVACNPPCGNGTCTSSRWNICNCFPGYRQHFANSISVPSSRTPRASFEHPAARLSHGELHFHEPPSQCWPVCYGCKGANCVAPNVCVGDTTTQKHDDLYSEPNVEFTTTSPEFYGYDTTENPADINTYSGDTNTTAIKNSWIEEHWVSIFIPLLVIATAVIMLLVWRWRPIITFFRGRSYVVEGDPVDTKGSQRLEDVCLGKKSMQTM